MNIRIKSSHFLARFRTELCGFFLGLRINLGKMYLSLSAKTCNFWQFFWRLFPGFLTDPSKLSGDSNRNFTRKSRRMWKARCQMWSTSIRDCNSRKSVRFLNGKWGYVGSWNNLTFPESLLENTKKRFLNLFSVPFLSFPGF